MGFGSELKQARLELGISAAKMAEVMGVDAERLRKWESRDAEPRDTGDRKSVAQFLEIDLDNFKGIDTATIRRKLKTGAPSKQGNGGSDILIPQRGERFYSGENEMEDLGNGLYRLHTLLVDQKSAAGYLTGWGDQEYLGELKHHSVIVRSPVRGVYRSFQINDNNESMYDPSNPTPNGIAPRDIVTARLLNRSMWRNKLHYKRWPFWVVVHKLEGITTKQIIDHKVESGIIMCHSLNPDKEHYPDFPLFLDDIIQLFNVIKVEKEL